MTLAFGIVGQLLGNRLRVPSIVFYLAAGLILGEVGIELATADTFGGSLTTVVGVAVAVILFDRAFALQFGRIREVSTTPGS